MAGYLGAIPVPQATQHRESFTATSGQTTFNTAGYTVGFLDVYLNGSHLSPADFTATNGSDVVLASGASTGDVCDIISYTAFEVNAQTFTGGLDVTGGITADGLTVETISEGAAPSNTPSDYDLAIPAANTDGYYGHNLGFYSGATPTVRASINSRDDGSGGAVGLTFHTGSGSTTDERLRISSGGDISFYEDTGTTAKLFWDASAESLGIGTSSPSSAISASSTVVEIAHSNLATLALNNTSASKWEVASAAGDFLTIRNDNSEAMRIDSSGNVLVGKTSSDSGVTAGLELKSDGNLRVTKDGGSTAAFNRLTSDGTIVTLQKDGTTVGSITSHGGSDLGIGAGDTGLRWQPSSDSIFPYNTVGEAGRDNAIDLGKSDNRFDDIYATNGTIQTSDRNEKQDIAALTSAEMLVAKRISALFKTFRWKDKVAAKGNDARTHTGIIAQDVQSAFTAESLDAGDYSLFISSTWWEHDVEVPAVEAVAEVTEDVVIAAVEEELDEEGNVLVEAQEERTEQRVITEAVEAVDAYTRTDTYDTEDEAPEGATSKTRMGIRYPELLSFVAAYNEQRFASIETRLTALEG